MYSSLERYIPLFEDYLKSQDPPTFICELTDSTERTVLTILTEKTTDINELRKKIR